MPEVMAALIILALISSSVFVVISRCMASVAETTSYMQAFEVARENMEEMLSSDSVEEKVDYGSSEKYPAIEWQTIVETFHVPRGSKMWVRAICSAEYIDMAGEIQTVELVHWLTFLTEQQKKAVLAERERQEQWLAEQGELIDEQAEQELLDHEPGEEEPETEDFELPDDLDPELRELFEKMLER